MRLDFDRFGDIQRILWFNPEVSDYAVHLGMAQQQLDCPQVARFLIDLGHLCSQHSVRAIGAGLQTN